VDEGTVTLSFLAGDRAGDPVQVLANGSLVLDTTELRTVDATSTACEDELNLDAFVGGADMGVSGSLCAGSGVRNMTAAAVSPFRSLYGRLAPILSLPPTGRPSFGACPTDSAPVATATIRSDPLVALVNHTLLVSDNYYAELIAKSTAASHALPTPSPPPSSPIYPAAIDTIKIYLAEKYGVDPSFFFQVDGSGLSRHNLVAVRALLALIESHAAISPFFFDLLPVGCVSGTLLDRFCGTPGAGRVHAKTGTETGIDALSGVVFDSPASEGGSPLIAFSIIVNGAPRRAEEVRQTIDQVVTYIIEDVEE
jgi:D-alanyl-D-alanine carboxypeptidase/D-alanyl-D-alanine-endopeptidase (penicillin-binding protein 4)